MMTDLKAVALIQSMLSAPCFGKLKPVDHLKLIANLQVYKGTLPDGQLIAIKRAGQASKQGALEFKTEIEILSRFHHKNVVSLVGFCFRQGEQMLVYEFIPNGSLKESLSGILHSHRLLF